jgi:hypothetical protein
MTLVDRSLVTVEDHPTGSRYRLHELVRQFAAARLGASGEADAIRSRHLQWYVDLVRRHSPGVRSLTTLNSVEPLLAEADNLAVAVTCALEQKDGGALVRILGGGGEMWAHVNKMRQLGEWWQLALPLLPADPDRDFPPNRLGLALVSATAATLNNGRYEDASVLATRALAVPGLSADARAFARWLELTNRLFRGTDLNEVAAPLEQLVEESTAGRLGVEIASRHWTALVLALTGSPGLARERLAPVHESAPEALEMLGPFTVALTGLADVVDGHVAEGVRALVEVSDQSMEQITHFRYFLLAVDALARVLAGQHEEGVPSAIRALTVTYESSMYPAIVLAVEAAALLAGRLGRRALAADAFATLDHTFAGHGGRAFCAQPATVLHPVRLAVEQRHGLAELRARPVDVLDMAERLRRELDRDNPGH